MAALGEEASRVDIQGYVRQKFGIKIGLDHISNCKGELAKRAAKATTPAAPGPRHRNRPRVRQPSRNPPIPIAGCSADAGCATPFSRWQRLVPRQHPLGRRADGQDPDRPCGGRPPQDADRWSGEVN